MCLGKGGVLTKTTEDSFKIKFATQGCWRKFVLELTKFPILKSIFYVLTYWGSHIKENLKTELFFESIFRVTKLFSPEKNEHLSWRIPPKGSFQHCYRWANSNVIISEHPLLCVLKTSLVVLHSKILDKLINR